MIKTSMLAWDKTQAIGAALAASERSTILAKLYKDLAGALRAGSKPHVVDGIEYAIHDWEAKGQAGPYFYQGIRADYESAIGTVDDETIVAIQIPRQGRRIIFSHLTMEDFVAAVMNQYAALDTDDEAVNELMDSDPRGITLEMCRAALAHDMSHAQVLTMSAAVDRIHQNGDFAEEIAAELEDWGWESFDQISARMTR